MRHRSQPARVPMGKDRDEHMTAAITSVGHYVPPGVVANTDFPRLDTSDSWIRTRTGIRERRKARGGGVSDLIVPAACSCLHQRGITADEVDCILVATVTPDYVFPATASIVRRKLGASNAWGYDVSAACCGFLYALVSAKALVEAGISRRVLVCGADRMTVLANEEDRSTAVLFGDGAGVALVESVQSARVGIVDTYCAMTDSDERHLYMPAGGSVQPTSAQTVAAREHFLVQDGRSVYRSAVEGMVEATATVLRRNGMVGSDVDWFAPHQANMRIMEAVAARLEIPPDRVMANIDRYGNTSSATIPICLSEWHASGRLRLGERIVLTAFGAGFCRAAVYLKWAVQSGGVITDET